MKNFNVSFSDVQPERTYTWEEILGKPGVYEPVSNPTYIMLITPCNNNRGIVFYRDSADSHNFDGGIFITKGEWDGVKYRRYQGTITLSNPKT